MAENRTEGSLLLTRTSPGLSTQMLTKAKIKLLLLEVTVLEVCLLKRLHQHFIEYLAIY